MQDAGGGHERVALISETGEGPFGNLVAIGPHRMLADEPASVGGLGAGPDPYEFLLAGLGACTAMTLRLYARRKGWPLDRLEVRVRHIARMAEGADEDVFDREIRLVGDLSAEERARLLDIANKCPVSRTLSRGSKITATLADAPPAGEAGA